MKRLPVTVLIPTRNRPAYLARCLSYYSTHLNELDVLVLDSSDDGESEQLCADIEGVRYQRYDAATSFAGKLAHGGTLTRAPFVTVCSDDDFIFVEGIAACTRFLAEHDDFSCAHGKYLRHWIEDDGELRFAETYRGHYATLLDTDLPAITRLQCHVNDYVPTFYAVTRTTVFTDIYDATDHAGVEFGLSEVLPSFLSVIVGKIARLPVMYASRESHRHDWVTEERKQQMYSADKITVAMATLSQCLPAQDTKSLLTLFSVGKGMTGVPLACNIEKMRTEKTARDYQALKIAKEELDWAVNVLTSLLLTKKTYSRQEMIKLREALYLT